MKIKKKLKHRQSSTEQVSQKYFLEFMLPCLGVGGGGLILSLYYNSIHVLEDHTLSKDSNSDRNSSKPGSGYTIRTNTVIGLMQSRLKVLLKGKHTSNQALCIPLTAYCVSDRYELCIYRGTRVSLNSISTFYTDGISIFTWMSN